MPISVVQVAGRWGRDAGDARRSVRAQQIDGVVIEPMRRRPGRRDRIEVPIQIITQQGELRVWVGDARRSADGIRTQRGLVRERVRHAREKTAGRVVAVGRRARSGLNPCAAVALVAATCLFAKNCDNSP